MGYSGGRVWVKTRDGVAAIGDDLEATTSPFGTLAAARIRGVDAGGDRVTLASLDGLVERDGGAWRATPMEPALHADQVDNIARTPDGTL